MTPVICQVKHDPENGTYGDCVRACIASLMDMDPPDVPHFYHDNCDGVTGIGRVREWLNGKGYHLMITGIGGEISLENVLSGMGELNPDVHYMLQGRTSEADHVVICKGGEVVHNPMWYKKPLIGPDSGGNWVIMAIVRL